MFLLMHMYNKMNLFMMMLIKLNNNIIMINQSPWPILLTINSMNLMMMIIFSMMFNFKLNWIINILMLSMIMILWNLNSNIYKIIYGYKNFFINISMKFLMYMFISSELMFFLTFFYMYFSNKYFNIFFYKKFYLNMFKLNFMMAMMNLIILMTSSLTFMIFTKMNKLNNMNQKFMFKTIILSLYFLIIQLIEYKFLNFNFNNSIFFSLFYLLTLFHMTHVIMGTIMMINIFINKMTMINNLFIKMIFICWYWHFIDFIWILILFIIYYFSNMYIMFNFQLKKN